MPCLELIVQTREANTESISDFLERSGAMSITWQAATEEALFEPDLETTPLWQGVNVHALFAENTPITPLFNALYTEFGEKIILNCQHKTIMDKVWERVWLDDFKPMRFGQRLWIRPTVFDPPVPNGIVVRLDPGLAFGTGTHPSTALCLEWIEGYLQSNKTMIDYGCGSGILAIAALKCGAQKVFAIDHDPQALEATQLNARQNAILSESISCLLPQQFQYDVKVDILIANILVSPLMTLAENFKSLIKQGGTCVLAGILSEQVENIHQCYVKQGFTLVDVQYKTELGSNRNAPFRLKFMNLVACGINHKTAPLIVREQLVFSPDYLALSLQELLSAHAV